MSEAQHVDREPVGHRRRRPARLAAMPEAQRHRLGIALFLLAAGLSFVLSVTLWFAGSHDEGLFVGIWVPSILSAGAFWLTAVAA